MGIPCVIAPTGGAYVLFPMTVLALGIWVDGGFPVSGGTNPPEPGYKLSLTDKFLQIRYARIAAASRARTSVACTESAL